MIDDVYQIALAAVRGHLKQAGMLYSEDDGDLVIKGHRLGLSIVFDGFTRQGEQTIAPLEVQIRLDGDEGDRFRIGTLGVGATQEAALKSAVAEWHVLAASPVLAALGAELGAPRRKPAATVLAGWQLFAGRAGLRGTVPPALHSGGSFYTLLLTALRDEVSRWETPRDFSLRSIFVMASAEVGAGAAKSGVAPVEVQSAVDGFVSTELTERLTALAWPPAAGAYFYKQLFVLRHDG
ncbi:MAG: hypothetical protein K8T91_08920 [Planctomycetes bacterium]|nr:hypothetical protein [Planctomycetota bacterium]